MDKYGKNHREAAVGCPARCCADPPCLEGRCVWLARYLVRQKWINAYARSVGLGKQVFRYAHPEDQRRYSRQGPCERCAIGEVCDMPCPEYVEWWDLRMEKLRRAMATT